MNEEELSFNPEVDDIEDIQRKLADNAYEFTFVHESRLDRLEDLSDSVIANLSKTGYSDEKDEIAAMTGDALASLLELRTAVDALIRDVTTQHKIRVFEK